MKRSKAALFITLIYVLVLCASFVLMLLTLESTPLAGIFLVFFTLPWPAVIDAALPGVSDSQPLVVGLLLLAGGLLNGVVLYLVISLLASTLRRTR